MSAELVPLHGEVVEAVGSLEENEAVIRKGLSTFVDVGRALQRIRDDGLYLEIADTFEEYVKERWGFAESTASNYVGGAQVHDTIFRKLSAPKESQCFDPDLDWSPNDLPASLEVAKPLVRVLNDDGEEAVFNAWAEILSQHRDAGPITSREVRQFFTVRANYATPPSWHELIGRVGDDLIAAEKHLTATEQAITRQPNQKLREKAAKYADWADALAQRLHALSTTEENES